LIDHRDQSADKTIHDFNLFGSSKFPGFLRAIVGRL